MKRAYSYTAKNSPEMIVRGRLVASSLNDALSELMKSGLVPIEIGLPEDFPAEKKIYGIVPLDRGIKSPDILYLTRQMANLTDCDLPVIQSIKLIAKRAKKTALKKLLESMAQQIEDGAMLSAAMAEHPAYFPSSYVHMVKSGEISGQLGKALRRVADFLDEDARQMSQIRAALYYPLFVFGVGIFTVTVMLTFVVPRMSNLFEEFQASLPLPTKILLAASYGLRDHGIPILLMAGTAGYCFCSWIQSGEGRSKWDAMLLRLPWFGPFLYQSEMVRLLRTLEMLLDNGVDMLAAITATREVMRNSVLKNSLKAVIAEVRGGASLSQGLSRNKIFDETVVGLVNMGEESGDLPKSLNQLAAMHERETASASAMFLSLLAPALLLLIVGFTGFVVAALLLPIAQMDILVR
jgi:type II secretory pathway component PulF